MGVAHMDLTEMYWWTMIESLDCKFRYNLELNWPMITNKARLPAEGEKIHFEKWWRKHVCPIRVEKEREGGGVKKNKKQHNGMIWFFFPLHFGPTEAYNKAK